MMRLFIAYPVQPEIQDKLGRLIEDLKSRDDSVKWVVPKNIHVTVRFLGDTREELIPAIKDTIDKIVTDFKAADCVIDRLGAFPNVRRPRVIWSGLDGDTDTLSQLAARMEEAVRLHGFEPEKKGFRPHITLGRVRKGLVSPDLVAFLEDHQLSPLPIRFGRVALVKSTLTPGGPIYEPLPEKMLG